MMRRQMTVIVGGEAEIELDGAAVCLGAAAGCACRLSRAGCVPRPGVYEPRSRGGDGFTSDLRLADLAEFVEQAPAQVES